MAFTRRTAAVAAIAAPLIALWGAPTAHAAQGFAVSVGASEIYAGGGELTGSITYTGTSSYRIDVSRLADICPVDGARVSMKVYLRFTDGSHLLTGELARDASGCGDGDYFTGSVSRSYERRIKEVKIGIFKCDDQLGGCSGFPEDIGYSSYKDNPNT